MDWIPSPVATLAAWGLTATFAWAALAKFIRGDAWPKAVTGFGFRGALAQTIVFAVPLAEIAIVALFVAGALRPAGALTLALVAGFSGAIVRARGIGNRKRVPCGCFGGSRDTDYRLLLARNLALAVLAALVLLGPRSASLSFPDDLALLPTALIAIGGLLLVWMTVQTANSLRRR